MTQNQLRLLVLGCATVFFLGGFLLELPFSMNYLQAKSFWKTSILLGLGVGGITATIVLWQKRQQLKETVGRMQLFASVFFFIILLTPLLLSWTNHLGLLTDAGIPTAVVFESEQARFSSRFGNSRLQKPQANQHLLFFYRNGQLYRIQNDQAYFPETQTGDTIYLNIIRGRLGYEWVAR